jgi:hypothetical protein
MANTQGVPESGMTSESIDAAALPDPIAEG